MKTYTPTKESVKRDWYVIDVEGKTLGRAATEIAMLLTGKRKPSYSPHMDMGDFVIVLNADKFHTTGNKMTDKLYRRHSGYPGGLKETNLKTLLEKHPTRALEFAVKGMMPKNRLRSPRMKRLKIYTKDTHPHKAQNPVKKEI
ncbi:MAG: 50S ribosomal protein L13 [Vulcanimicrobiota bacterium]